MTRFWLGRSGARRLLIRQPPRRPRELFPPKRTIVRCLRVVFLEEERKFHHKKSQNRSGGRATNHQQRFIKKWHLSVSANTVSILNFEGMNENNQNTCDSDDQLWKTERVAKYLHVTPKTIFNLRKRGLPYVQLHLSTVFTVPTSFCRLGRSSARRFPYTGQSSAEGFCGLYRAVHSISRPALSQPRQSFSGHSDGNDHPLL